MKTEIVNTLTNKEKKSLETLGEALALLRETHGLSQTELAKRTEISRNTIYRMERGDPGVSIGAIIKCTNLITEELLSDVFLDLIKNKVAKKNRGNKITTRGNPDYDF